jgi:hypothetical protein
VSGRGGSAGGDAGLTIGQGANDHGFHEVFGVHRVPRPRECRGRVLAVEIEHDFGAAWVSGNSLRGLDFSDRGGQEFQLKCTDSDNQKRRKSVYLLSEMSPHWQQIEKIPPVKSSSHRSTGSFHRWIRNGDLDV